MSNQTIDGVPRELLRWMHDFINDGLALSKEEASVCEQLRALLAKPAEQPAPAAVISVDPALQQVGVVDVVEDGYSTCYTGIMFAKAILDGTIKDGDKLYVIKEKE